jgi:hypothetical protein
MKPTNSCGYRVLCLLLVAMMSMLAGCGGGGGGGGSSSGAPGAPGASTGTVAVFVKDGPSDQFEHIWVTITQVELLPVSGAPVVIYDNPSGCRIDILDHRNEDFLLKIQKDVPAGQYSKIRLRVSDIELDPTASSSIGSDIEVKLPSGKIDLNPREPFTIAPGGNLSIRLDIDANKAIHVHPSKVGWYIFRPVVFVDIEAGFPAAICPKIVHGTITELVKSGSKTTGFVMTLDDGRGTLDVKLSSDTDIFLSYGEFGEASDLTEGQEVWVRGKMDSSGALVASLVIIGKVVDLSGEVANVVSPSEFWLTMLSGEAFLGTYVVRIDPVKTLILTDCNTEVGPEAIQEGMVARIFAKLVGIELHAVVVVLRAKEVTGEITAESVVSGGRQLTVLPEGGTTGVQILVPTAAPIYIDGDGQVSASYLTAGRNVRILLDPAIASPVTAKKVFIVGQKVEGTVSSVGSGTMVVDGLTVRVPAGATILDLRSGCSLVPFSTIAAGDKVVYFGLETTGAAFEAPVVLIVG